MSRGRDPVRGGPVGGRPESRTSCGSGLGQSPLDLTAYWM